MFLEGKTSLGAQKIEKSIRKFNDLIHLVKTTFLGGKAAYPGTDKLIITAKNIQWNALGNYSISKNYIYKNGSPVTVDGKKIMVVEGLF